MEKAHFQYRKNTFSEWKKYISNTQKIHFQKRKIHRARMRSNPLQPQLLLKYQSDFAHLEPRPPKAKRLGDRFWAFAVTGRALLA